GQLQPKIGDWGSARAVALYTGMRSMTHGVGTTCWLAPEVIKDAKCSEKADVYAFGILLWELATREQVGGLVQGPSVPGAAACRRRESSC
ncbi:unnamed protein product, partial [Hapterophycus canaliculatus]